jgi:hypothetical protein
MTVNFIVALFLKALPGLEFVSQMPVFYYGYVIASFTLGEVVANTVRRFSTQRSKNTTHNWGDFMQSNHARQSDKYMVLVTGLK